jgi:hypothetical protein
METSYLDQSSTYDGMLGKRWPKKWRFVMKRCLHPCKTVVNIKMLKDSKKRA